MPFQFAVALYHRVNVLGDDFERLLEVVIASGAKIVILSQWSADWPWWGENVANEDALKAKIDAALTRCDQAGMQVYFETAQLSGQPYGNPTYLPTIAPDPIALVTQNFLTDNLESDEPFFFDLTPNTEPDYRLFYDVTCEPWRYYEFSVYISCKGHSGKVGGLGFYRYDEDTQQYYKVSGAELKPGYNRIRFHSLDCAKWQFVFFAGAFPLRIIPAQLAERLPEAGEILALMGDDTDMDEMGAYWGCNTPMYKCILKDAGNFSAVNANPENRHKLWNSYLPAIRQWEWLKSRNHPCLVGMFAKNDEPCFGYQRGVIERWGSVGEAYTEHVETFVELGYAITGQKVLIYSDPFDPHHNGQKYIRANCPIGGGFATAPGALREELPAVFLVWNEDNMQSLQKSITYWSESGREWWLALYSEYNNAQQAAEMIFALPEEKRPKTILIFTWEMGEYTIEKLSAKFAFFKGR
jgi:hypothetical protein